MEPVPAGAGPSLVGRTVLILPFASNVNSSMHTERRKEFPFDSSLVWYRIYHLPLNWTTEPCCVTEAACSITLPA